MKIIDLLVKIANGEEVPKKIKYRDQIWIYDKRDQDYKENNKNDNDLLGYFFCNCRTNDFINDEVEIIEDKPKKIELLSYQRIGSWSLEQHKYIEYAMSVDKQLQQIGSKVNEIAKALNYLLEKSDKE